MSFLQELKRLCSRTGKVIFYTAMDKEQKKEKNVGLYATIIFHLLLIIVLLCASIRNVIVGDPVFELDFSAQEAQEEIEKLELMKEQAAREVEEMLAAASSTPASAYRNIAVDRNSALKDDRHANPDAVMEEARELQRKLNQSKADASSSEDDEVAVPDKSEKKENAPQYKGPTVLSYSLDGRKAIYLPVPVYKCMGGGDVSIQISVNRKGKVVAAKVIEAASVSDECIRKAALDAAKRSTFSASSKAPEKQIGDITYRFIAQ